MQCSFDAVVEPVSGGGSRLTVTGSVRVSNPGVKATFAERVPQGINPDVLLMTLVLEAGPGAHPQVMTERALAFHRDYPAGAHVPSRIEVHTTSGETFGCAAVRAH